MTARRILYMLLLAALAAHGQGRLIGIVYDNSGSMRDAGRDKPTAYSFQLLSALFVPGDTLAIMTMEMAAGSRTEPLIFPYEKLPEMIAWLDRLDYRGATPSASVIWLLQFLASSGNPHKCIAILTDGQFSDEPDLGSLATTSLESGLRGGYLVLNPAQDEQKTIDQQRVLPLLMEKLNGDPDKGRFVLQRTDYSDLPGTMGALFCQVTGLTTAEQQPYIHLDGATVRIQSPFPLKRIRLISQALGHKPEIRHLNFSGDRHLANHHLDLPDGSTVYAMAGWIEIGAREDSAAALEVTFAASLDPERLFLLLDTNLDLNTSLLTMDQQRLIPQGDQYQSGWSDSLFLKASFTSEGSKFHFSADLRKKLKLTASIRGGGTLRLETQDGIYFGTTPFLPVSSDSQRCVIDVFAEYPGHFRIQKTITINLGQVETILLLNGQRAVPGVWDRVTTCNLDDIRPIRVSVISADSINMTEKYSITFAAVPDIKRKLDRSATGEYNLSFGHFFFPWKDPSGTVELQITAVPPRSYYRSHVVTVRIEIAAGSWWCRWLPFFIGLLLLLLALGYLVAQSRARRFRRHASLFEQRRDPRAHFQPNPEIRKLRSCGSLIISWLLAKSERRTLPVARIPLTFIAGPYGEIRISKKSAHNVKNLIINYEDLDKASLGGTIDVIIYPETKMTTRDGLAEIWYYPKGHKPN